MASVRDENTSEALQSCASSLSYGSFPVQPDSCTGQGYSVKGVRVVCALVAMLVGCCQSLGVVSQYLMFRLDEANGAAYNESAETSSNYSLCLDDDMRNDSRRVQANEMQAKASTLVMYFIFASSFPALVTSLTIGAFADHLGRRFTLLLPLFGLTIKLVIFTCIVKFKLELWVFFIGYTIEGLVGGGPVIRIALYSMVADTNAEKQTRMFWMALINGFSSVLTSASSIFTGILVHNYGFFPAMSFYAMTMAVTFLIPFFFLSETLPLHSKPTSQDDKMMFKARSGRAELVSETMPRQGKPTSHDIMLFKARSGRVDFVSNREVYERQTNKFTLFFKTLYTNWKRVFLIFLCDGPLKQRTMLALCIGMFFFTVVIEFSYKPIDTLYQLHYPFCWDATLIGYYSALKTGGQSLVGMLLLKILQCCMREDLIGMVSALFQAGGYVMQAFVKNTWQLFLVPVVGIPGNLTQPVVRGMMSMLAGPNNQGAMFTSLAVVDMLCHIIGCTTFNGIYAATVRTFPGEVYLFMALSSLITFVFFVFYYCVQDKRTAGHEDVEYDLLCSTEY